ncbi:hypothetical protein, partial [Neisseria meningitidis]|uniref:hypothetical protein n=1 Tax=Neisseria meningitidis TaxID=487 RepID=UPI001C5663DD
RETVDVFGNHGLCGLPEEGAHGKSPKWLGGNLGDFGEFCKGLLRFASPAGRVCDMATHAVCGNAGYGLLLVL